MFSRLFNRPKIISRVRLPVTNALGPSDRIILPLLTRLLKHDLEVVAKRKQSRIMSRSKREYGTQKKVISKLNEHLLFWLNREQSLRKKRLKRKRVYRRKTRSLRANREFKKQFPSDSYIIKYLDDRLENRLPSGLFGLTPTQINGYKSVYGEYWEAAIVNKALRRSINNKLRGQINPPRKKGETWKNIF